MRTTSKFRRTKTFSILAGEAVDMCTIVNYYGRDKLVAISRDPQENYGIYIVRICEARALIDVKVYVNYTIDQLEEIERVVIVPAPKEQA